MELSWSWSEVVLELLESSWSVLEFSSNNPELSRIPCNNPKSFIDFTHNYLYITRIFIYVSRAIVTINESIQCIRAFKFLLSTYPSLQDDRR
jgi:hypothetical protein